MPFWSSPGFLEPEVEPASPFRWRWPARREDAWLVIGWSLLVGLPPIRSPRLWSWFVRKSWTSAPAWSADPASKTTPRSCNSWRPLLLIAQSPEQAVTGRFGPYGGRYVP